MVKYILLSLFLIFIGCGNNKHSSSTSTNVNSNLCIRAYTLGNIINASVVDSDNQIATYDKNLSKYCFSKAIKYPIFVKVLPDTYIDVDYDNKKTSNDILPKFTILKSYFPYVDLITDIHARAVDNNNTNVLSAFVYYKDLLESKYPINLQNSGFKENILNFVAYDYNLSNNLDINSSLFDSFNNLVLFFDNNFNKPSIKDRVKYYSFFHSLELLDKKLINRVDTLNKPKITFLHRNNLPIQNNLLAIHTDILVKDIKADDNGVYTASGLDGVFKFDNYLNLVSEDKVNQTFSNSYNLDFFKTSSNKYLLVADGGEGLDVFDITSGNFNYLNKIFWKYRDSKGKDNPITIDDSKGLKQVDEIISLKSYVSPFENNMWLAFGTKNKGLFLVDLKKILPKFQSSDSYPIIYYDDKNDTANNLWIQGDGGSVYSEAFSSDGENLYATKSNSIERYDLSSILTISTPMTYQIKGDYAYNLKMISKNGVDELFVTTNRGVELYDVLNNGDLNFTSEYNTEGAEDGYLPKIDFISEKNILLFTDGYKGLKAIKYDSSYNPTLCGVGYFSPFSDDTKLAKVTSVFAYKDGENYYVLAGVDGLGLVKFNLDDLLFKHCQ